MATRSIIPVGRLQVATPYTMAASIRGNTEATDAVDERVQDVAADVIASDPTIIQAARDAAGQAVDEEIVESNLVQAYSDRAVTYTTLDAIPMTWTFNELDDPYPSNTYTSDVYPGFYKPLPRKGDMPVLDPQGKLTARTIPADFPTTDQVQAAIDAAVADAIASLPEPSATRVNAPTFRARLARARTLNLPLAVVFAGSSTTEAQPGYIGHLTEGLQSLYPVETPTAPQWSDTATFTEHTEPGLHEYSAGQGGARSNDYLTDAESGLIAALEPAFILHMVGANDYTTQVPPSTYAANLRARVQYLQGVLTEPCQHIFVHPYARLAYTPPTYQWDQYRDAMRGVADETAGGVFIDLSPSYVENGVPGADPLDLIGPDNVHQTAAGYRFMADLIALTLSL